MRQAFCVCLLDFNRWFCFCNCRIASRALIRLTEQPIKVISPPPIQHAQLAEKTTANGAGHTTKARATDAHRQSDTDDHQPVCQGP